MEKFDVVIREVLEKKVTIEAENEESALGIAGRKYGSSEIVLTADDYVDATITLLSDIENNK